MEKPEPIHAGDMENPRARCRGRQLGARAIRPGAGEREHQRPGAGGARHFAAGLPRLQQASMRRPLEGGALPKRLRYARVIRDFHGVGHCARGRGGGCVAVAGARRGPGVRNSRDRAARRANSFRGSAGHNLGIRGCIPGRQQSDSCALELGEQVLADGGTLVPQRCGGVRAGARQSANAGGMRGHLRHRRPHPKRLGRGHRGGEAAVGRECCRLVVPLLRERRRHLVANRVAHSRTCAAAHGGLLRRGLLDCCCCSCDARGSVGSCRS